MNSINPNIDSKNRKNIRRFRFTLRSVLAVTILFAAILSVLLNPYYKEARAISYLESNGLVVDDARNDPFYEAKKSDDYQIWHHRFTKIVFPRVGNHPKSISFQNAVVSNEILKRLCRISNVRVLNLDNCRIPLELEVAFWTYVCENKRLVFIHPGVNSLPNELANSPEKFNHVKIKFTFDPNGEFNVTDLLKNRKKNKE